MIPSATLASGVLSKPPKCTHNSMVFSCGIYHLLYNTTLTHWSKRSPFFELHHINTENFDLEKLVINHICTEIT